MCLVAGEGLGENVGGSGEGARALLKLQFALVAPLTGRRAGFGAANKMDGVGWLCACRYRG